MSGILDLLRGAVQPAMAIRSGQLQGRREAEQDGRSILEHLQAARAAAVRQAQLDAQQRELQQSQVAENLARADALRAPKVEAPRAPVMGSPEWLAAQEKLAKIRAQNARPRQGPTPHYSPVQTEGGVGKMNSLTGEIEPVMDATGQQVQPKTEGGIKQKVATNRITMSAIDDAIAQIQKHPTAIGARRLLLPDMVSQRTDPEGVLARAAISDVGSLKIHERTGAAMSPKEWKRLSGFIPTENDDSETAIKKLQRMKEIIAEETDALAGNGRPPASPASDSRAVPLGAGVDVKALVRQMVLEGKSDKEIKAAIAQAGVR